MTFTLPGWFPAAPAHSRACWLCASHHAKDYNEARRMVGRMEKQARSKVSVERYQAGLEKQKLN